MFTGLVEEVGILESISGDQQASRLVIQAQKVLEDVQIGDSIAVNGVCLTVTTHTVHRFQVDVMPQTLQHTNLRHLVPGHRVNLERALRLGDRLGGHLVSGHVDGTGTILGRQEQANAVLYRIQTGPELLKYVMPRGSICLDGISLTVVDVEDSSFRVSVIPHTLAVTSLQDRHSGDLVNLEADMIGKYVERLLQHASPKESVDRPSSSSLNIAFLQENGFA